MSDKGEAIGKPAVRSSTLPTPEPSPEDAPTDADAGLEAATAAAALEDGDSRFVRLASCEIGFMGDMLAMLDLEAACALVCVRRAATRLRST